MISDFHHLRVTRKNALDIIEDFSYEQLNKIPVGFSNNLIWNFGHSIITQQLLCYHLNGLEIKTNPELTNKYKKGSRPEGRVEEDEIKLLKSYLFSTIDLLESDFKNGLFQNYREYTTSYGVTLKNIEQAIRFNAVHEGMHLGYMYSIRKFLND